MIGALTVRAVGIGASVAPAPEEKALLNPLVSCDTSPSAQAQRLTQVCAAAAFGIALLTAAGWLLDAPFLAGQWGRAIPMAPSTALALLFLSGGVFSNACWPAHRLTRPIGLTSSGETSLIDS